MNRLRTRTYAYTACMAPYSRFILVLLGVLALTAIIIFSQIIRQSFAYTVKNPAPKVLKILPYDPNFKISNINNEIEMPNVSIEINIPAREMTVFEDGEEMFKKRVAIGQPIYPTPEQNEFIHVIEWNPWWYPPDSKWARNDKPTPPGPKNPLGPVKLRIGMYGDVLLHGTNKTWTVGRPTSHGCMRMFNFDARSLAWFLQSKFSEKTDPKLLTMYSEKSGSTFRVTLGKPVPVQLVYKPVIVRNDKLVFYPDVYNRFSGKLKSTVISELVRSGVDIGLIDDIKLSNLIKKWPTESTEVSLSDLLIDPPSIDLLSAPECS